MYKKIMIAQKCIVDRKGNIPVENESVEDGGGREGQQKLGSSVDDER
jgi:hypothetical protein